jgi:hypothetical protein
MREAPAFEKLEQFLLRVPGINGAIGSGSEDSGWWAKFSIDIENELAWNVVQELSHVLNYLSVEERLPTRFMPVSPPPYLNGGPAEFPSWVIECEDLQLRPDTAAEWLEGRLPRPVDDLALWRDQ